MEYPRQLVIFIDIRNSNLTKLTCNTQRDIPWLRSKRIGRNYVVTLSCVPPSVRYFVAFKNILASKWPGQFAF